MARSHKWAFKARFRSGAYGWRGSQLAARRLNEAVREIKRVAKADPALAGEGCVSLMERLWPALEHIDSSTGALGAAVNRTLDALIPILIAAPCDKVTRDKWLARLYEAVADDGVQYLYPVEERWGEICVFPDLVHEWADRFVPFVRQAWQRGEPGEWVVGATLCLSCLLEAGRYAELEELLSYRRAGFWSFDRFHAEALARQGRTDEAIQYAESRQKNPYGRLDIIAFCERALLQAGRREEAYQKYGLIAEQATRYLDIFRRTAEKYPERDPRQILVDLIEARGAPGKWFAAAKDAGHLDVALQCARSGGVEPQTLIRAARDYVDKEPAFAAEVALCAIRALLSGRGYEPSPLEIRSAYNHLMVAAERIGQMDRANEVVEQLLAQPSSIDDAMRKALRDEMRLERERKTSPDSGKDGSSA